VILEGREEKDNPMGSRSRTLVHQLLARQLQIDGASIHDAQRFDDLGLEPLNLVLVVLQIEDSAEKVGDFPLAALDHTQTVGELVGARRPLAFAQRDGRRMRRTFDRANDAHHCASWRSTTWRTRQPYSARTSPFQAR